MQPIKSFMRHFFLLSIIFLPACGAMYRGPVSSHFDGRRFFNPEPNHSFGDMVKWLWEMETVAWPRWVDDPPQPAPPERVGAGDLRVTYINHATMLLQLDELNILTDPIWSERAGPVSWLGTKRVRAPGVSFDDLPPIDVVLISHDHYDHLDLPTLRRIMDRHLPIVLAGLGVKRHLDDALAERTVELDWWQSHVDQARQVQFTFVPARHQSGRAPFRENVTLWGGFLINSPAGQVYFAGDTAIGSFLDELHNHITRLRLAILPVGSYEKRWFMQSQHLNPDDAVSIHCRLGAPLSIGMHFGTFAEHPEQTIDAHEKDLVAALHRHDVAAEQFRLLKFGESLAVPPLNE